MIRGLILLIVIVSSGFLASCDENVAKRDSEGRFSSDASIKAGDEIYFQDPETGTYHNGSVESARRSGSQLEIRIHNYDTGQYQTIYKKAN